MAPKAQQVLQGMMAQPSKQAADGGVKGKLRDLGDGVIPGGQPPADSNNDYLA